MCWIKVFIICTLISLLQAQKECIQLIRWDDLLQSINSLSSKIAHECVHHFDKTSLCDPQLMLSKMEHNEILISDIMNKAESMYQKNPHSHNFMEKLGLAQQRLTSCAHQLSNSDHEPVVVCFNKLEAFLIHKKDHLRCAWEIVNVTVREIFQRLENRTVRGLRR